MRAALSTWGRLSRRDHWIVPLRDRHTARARIAASPLPAIPYGNGRSYGDEALNDGGTVWLTRGLDRFIGFDVETGLLHCEAGVTLEEIIAVALPHGWFLPVTPGTQFATLGGAVANDVHGKNHHSHGTLGEHVRALTLLRSDGSAMACGPAQNADWFRATVGGMGLTGLISDVVLQLRRVAGPWIRSTIETFGSLTGFFELSSERSDAFEYSVAWIDCMGKRDVRGVFLCGDHDDSAAPQPKAAVRSAHLLPPLRWVTPAATRAFNALYFRRSASRAGPSLQSYRSFFYPLDGVLEWNRLYGRAGFYQYQCVVPQSGQREAVAELLKAVAASGTGSFLSVLKTFGTRPALGLLSFPMPGTTLALDFANEGASTRRLFERLDAITAAAGGRLYAAKDAAMTPQLFRLGYPRLDEFTRFRDPGISSEMSRRLLGS